jgi:hypothetical protein
MNTKIEIGDVYKSKRDPSRIARVESVAGEVVALKTESGVTMTLPIIELEGWTKQELATNRYFITYTTSEGQIGRTGIRRNKTIESLADIEDIEKFIEGEMPKDDEGKTTTRITVTGFQPFEVGQGIVERAIIAAQLLGFISEQDMTNVPWFTPDLKKAITDVIS